MVSARLLFITRSTLMIYAAKRSYHKTMSQTLFEVVLSGAVNIEINQTYPLSETAQAHRDLEARKTTGSTVLLSSPPGPRSSSLATSARLLL